MKKYFSKGELLLWISSMSFIIIAFLLFDRVKYFNLIASLIGVTSLIFAAKGNPVSQVLMIIFSIIYGVISFSFSYYGEMITYLGMTLPMAVISLVSWLKNPYNSNKSQVKVNIISKTEILLALALTAIVTAVFYFVLRELNTANLFFSTVSVATSFFAVYLTFRRSPLFALAYAANDVVLIVLWVMATIENVSFVSVVICFIVFFVNDIYGFISWQKMRKIQESGA